MNTSSVHEYKKLPFTCDIWYLRPMTDVQPVTVRIANLKELHYPKAHFHDQHISVQRR